MNSSLDLRGYSVYASYLRGLVGSLDMRGGPWYLGAVDLQLSEDLLVNGNTTSTYYFGDGSLLTGINNTHVEGDNIFLYNDSDTMYFNSTKLGNEYLKLDTSNDPLTGELTGDDITATDLLKGGRLHISGNIW